MILFFSVMIDTRWIDVAQLLHEEDQDKVTDFQHVPLLKKSLSPIAVARSSHHYTRGGMGSVDGSQADPSGWFVYRPNILSIDIVVNLSVSKIHETRTQPWIFLTIFLYNWHI